MSIKTFAAIDVGSFELTMKIYEFPAKNVLKEIDRITTQIDLGGDTYATGKISNEKMDELCRELERFSSIMKAYRVNGYRAYATSAIREAKNGLIVLDQITQRTGLEVKVLSNSEQRFLNYKAIASKGNVLQKIIEEKTAILDIGGGSIQISLFDNDTLVSTQNLRLGVLRIQEILNHLNAGSSQMDELVDEIVTAQMSPYKKLYLKDREIKNIIIVDDYLSPLTMRLSGKDPAKATISLKGFDNLSEMFATTSQTDLARKLDMPEEKIPLLRISAVMVRRIADMMGAEAMWAPGVTLSDGIAYEYAEENKLIRWEHDFEKDILACAGNISKRYMGSRKRAETLENIATAVFDSMKKIHGMGARERLLLRLATLMHDCGKYISLVNIGETSYDIIMATEIIGLSHMERELVANIVRFNHSDFADFEMHGYRDEPLNRNNYLTVAKLTAILRLANSLDRSHRQKLKGVKAQLVENELILTVDTQEDVTLERGYMDMSVEFFQEVFSVVPVLRSKKKF
ncbi:MAG: exopolyphosphatase [Acetatifactor sp.]